MPADDLTVLWGLLIRRAGMVHLYACGTYDEVFERAVGLGADYAIVRL